MSDPTINLDRLFDLVGAVCDEDASHDELVELDSLATVDREACRRYLGYCRMHGTLSLELWADRASQAVYQQIGIKPTPAGSSESEVVKIATADFPAPAFPGALFDSTAGFLASGWPVAYLVATVVFAIGALVGSLVYVSQPVQVVRQSAPSPAPLSPLPSVVGRITGMVDCRWGENPKSELRNPKEIINPKSEIINPNSLVSLGDKFVLASGLMEITYDTGARVILQGPVTYEVESAAGGYLAMGKLTAKLEKKREGGRGKAEEATSLPSPAGRGAGGEGREKTLSPSTLTLALSQRERGPESNPQSPIPNPSPLSPLPSPLFSVRTPTAIVTDLGTEFGVEVGKEGQTISHVFRGTVKVKVESTSASSAKGEREVVLRANESVRVERHDAARGIQRLAIVRTASLPMQFVRNLPPPEKPSPLHVLAWFRMGEDDPGAVAGQSTGDQTIDHGHSSHLKKYGTPTHAAGAAPGSSLAVDFAGKKGEYFYSRYVCWAPVDNFIVEAWARATRSADKESCLVYTGRPADDGKRLLDGYGLFLIDGHYKYLLGGVVWSPPLGACVVGKWTHLALVCQQGKAQFWVDGQRVYEAAEPIEPIASSGHFMIGGVPGSVTIPNAFDGLIDEVRLSEFDGPFDPKMLLWHKLPEKEKR